MGPLTYQRIASLAGITLFIHILLGYTTFNNHNTRPVDTTPFAVNHQHSTSTNSQPVPDSSNCSHELSTSAKTWEFNVTRDAYNYGLSPEQCDAAFPGMWAELDRAVAHRQKVGNITPAHVMIDWKVDGIIRAMIYDRQLFILDTKGVQRRDYRQRSIAVLQSIQRAITAFPGDIPNIEFSFVVDDGAYFAVNEKNTRATTWALTREPKDTSKNLWIMPDFGFYSWEGPAGEYASVLRSIKENEMAFEKKDMRAVWRGARSPAGHVKVREDLLRVSKGRSWADIEAIQWGSSEPPNLIALPKHCRYMFTVHTEGHTYSGRLKYLLNCHSLTIIHKLFWIESFHHLLIPSGPDQNYIEVKSDFSDLEQKVQYYLQHQDEARRIADNSVKTFRDRYLTPAAQACYWRKMFHSWREVSFEPSFYMTVEEERQSPGGKLGGSSKLDNGTNHSAGENRSSREKIPRGMPYETYILLEAYEDNPWYKDEATKLD